MKGKGALIAVLIISFVALIAIVVYANYAKKNNQAGSGGTGGTSGQGTGGQGTGSNTGAPKEFPLRMGSENDYVGELQKYVQNRGNCLPIYGVDGRWGNETEACVVTVLGTNVVNWDLYKSLGLT